MQLAEPLPHWDLSNVYAGLEADDYRHGFAQLDDGLGHLAEWFDAKAIGRLAELPSGNTPGEIETLRETLSAVLVRLNELGRLADTLSAFVYAFFSTDSFNAVAAREVSKLELLGVRRQKLDVRLRAWIGSLSPWLEAWAGHDRLLGEHEFFLRNSARRSRYLMSEELESLAAELCIDAGGAFGKLQGSVTSQLVVPLERDGKTEPLPITAVRNFVFDPDPALRERAYRAEQAGWESIRTTVAACLNGVKGTALTLARRRGWPSVLDWAIDDNRIDRPTLDALLGAIHEALPMFRRYLKAKARKLGLKQLRWWDLFAPVAASTRRFEWSQARGFIVEKFASFSGELGRMAQAFRAALDRRRAAQGQTRRGVLHVGRRSRGKPRPGQLRRQLRPGQHAGPRAGPRLSQSLSARAALAVAGRSLDVGRNGQHLLRNADRRRSPGRVPGRPAEQLTILEAQLSGATQVCLDIRSRFHFEQGIFERRGESELSADEFCQRMLDAQAATYADAIDPATYHRYMWLWKPHYYAYDHNFYNFPYAFGHLFSLGLYAIYRQTGPAFVPRYDALLRATNQDYAAPLAARFGLDITTIDFWRQSLQVIAGQVERFEGVG